MPYVSSTGLLCAVMSVLIGGTAMSLMAYGPGPTDAVLFRKTLSSLDDVDVITGEASIVSVGDTQALKLDGLALVQSVDL